MKPQPAAQPTNTTGTPRQSLLRATWHHLLDFVFPPMCVNCGRVDTGWCAHCHQALAEVPVRPHHIGHPLLSDIVDIVSSGPHEGLLQNAAVALKYHDVAFMAEPLGQRIVSVVQQMGWSGNMLVPVPLSERRLRERGYNQAELIASVAGRTLGVPCQPLAIRRQRHTRPQVGLTASERLENVRQAFMADTEQVAGQRIVLVDDVHTTGATLISCALAALDAGARSVTGLTVTHAGSSTI